MREWQERNGRVTRRRGTTVQGCAVGQSQAERAGVDILIRYITRAGVRVDTRNRLFAMIVELMQGVSKENRNLASLSPHGSLKG